MTKENFISIIKELIYLNKKIISFEETTQEEASALDHENIYLFSVVAALRRDQFVFTEVDEGYAEGFSYRGDEDFDDWFEDEYEEEALEIDKVEDYFEDEDEWEGNWPDDVFDDDELESEHGQNTHYREMIEEILGDISVETV